MDIHGHAIVTTIMFPTKVATLAYREGDTETETPFSEPMLLAETEMFENLLFGFGMAAIPWLLQSP